MRRIRSTITLILVVAAALLSATAPSLATTAAPSLATVTAPAPFGPPVTLAQNCPLHAADAAIAADGTVRGYLSCGTWDAPTIWYFRYQGGTVFAQPTPYHGLVLRAAWDGLNSTYLLFSREGPGSRSELLQLGKRLENTGQYAPTTLLATTYPAGLKKYLAAIQAGLVAYRSAWWAVWTEPIGGFGGVGGEPTFSLFQRRTLLGAQPRTRMTYPPFQNDDSMPTLAYSPGLMTAAWLRGDSGTDSGRVTLGTNTGHGWTARPLPATSPLLYPLASPDLISYVGVRHLAWPGHSAVGVASDILRSFTPHLVPAARPPVVTVAASGSNVFVLWSDSGSVFAERQAGTWSPATLMLNSGSPVRVLAQGGRARVLYWLGSALLLREQN